jgi:hypothetical protein
MINLLIQMPEEIRTKIGEQTRKSLHELRQSEDFNMKYCASRALVTLEDNGILLCSLPHYHYSRLERQRRRSLNHYWMLLTILSTIDVP